MLSSNLRAIADDKAKLKSLIQMCMNDEYAKASKEEKQRKLRRNKATFSNNSVNGENETVSERGGGKELKDFDEVGLAFRKSALNALN